MAEAALRLTITTPQGEVFDEPVTSLRVPSDTGQVGLRPRAEPAALLVEPGLVLAAARDGVRFVATLGGMLRCDGEQALLLTPLAVVGESATRVRAQLEEALREPTSERELRAALQRLETGILSELRRESPLGRGGRRG